nr:hypothetical protein [Burkholderia cenocepacia]
MKIDLHHETSVKRINNLTIIERSAAHDDSIASGGRPSPQNFHNRLPYSAWSLMLPPIWPL